MDRKLDAAKRQAVTDDGYRRITTEGEDEQHGERTCTAI